MIYFDEAGNSGDNLIDIDQPVYVLLSHDFKEEEVKAILSPLLKISKAKELHFKQLKKYARSRQAIIECINHPLVQTDRVFHYVAHKEFMIVIHIVDKLIEPVFYEQGIDIYKGGFNISTANILYIMGKNVWDRDLFTEMCRNFVVWMRSKKVDDGVAFYKTGYRLYATLKHDRDKQLLSWVLDSLPLATSILGSIDKYSLDATLSCFNAHCDFWAKTYNRPFDITFDKSKQIDYWEDMIKFLTDHIPEGEVGYGSRKHKYPLLINSLATVSSETSVSLQLADLFCSSLNYCYGLISKKKSDEFGLSIDNSALVKSSRKVMWPGTEMTPEELDMTDETGMNALDFIAAAADQNPDAFKKALRKDL
jgi:hypothetical protein